MMNEAELQKQIKAFKRSQSRTARYISVITGILSLVLFGLLAQRLIQTSDIIMLKQFSEGTPLLEVYLQAYASSVLVFFYTAGGVIFGLLGILLIFEGFYINPKNKLLEHLIEKEKP